jgi:SAM-dependent methyltransferase
MGNEFKGQVTHSAEHFGDTRDHWWNLDFLQLVAKRWNFDAIGDALDVGRGVGHWGKLLASVMPGHVRVIGVDREPSWVAKATARALSRGLEGRFSYRQGEVEHLPFPDNSFDLTTCQTLLIHVPDPTAAISEMMRVTRPGGLVVVAEPNNLTESLLLDSISNLASIDDIVELVRFQLTCERDKVALGSAWPRRFHLSRHRGRRVLPGGRPKALQSAGRWLAGVDRQLSVEGSLVGRPRFAASDIGGQGRVFVQNARCPQPEQHRRHHQVARTERAIEPVGIAQANGKVV